MYKIIYRNKQYFLKDHNDTIYPFTCHYDVSSNTIYLIASYPTTLIVPIELNDYKNKYLDNENIEILESICPEYFI